MSYRIEYRYKSYKLPGSELQDGIDRYFILVEGGDNNLYEGRSSRRVRSWSVDFIGTHDQIMQIACKFAASAEDGGLKPAGRWISAESYIKKIRTLLKNAEEVNSEVFYTSTRIQLEYKCAIGSEMDNLLTTKQVEREEKKMWYSEETLAMFSFRDCHKRPAFNLFFEVYDSIFKAQGGWNFAKV